MTATVTLTSDLLDPTSTSQRASLSDERAVLSFPPFRLDLFEQRLWKGEREVQLRPKPFAILRYLALQPRRLVTRSEIVDAVWGRQVAMSEGLFRTHLHDLRRTVGEAVIETVVGRGYRFMAPLDGWDGASPRRRSGVAASSMAPRATQGAPDRRFKLLKALTAGSVEPTNVRSPARDAHARILKQLTDSLAAFDLSAGIVLVVADAKSMGLRLTASSGPEPPAPARRSATSRSGPSPAPGSCSRVGVR
jgi:DNA-binding winged helix-turn-helix (wHTH) protein